MPLLIAGSLSNASLHSHNVLEFTFVAHSHILIPDLQDWGIGWRTAMDMQGEHTDGYHSPVELDADEAGT